MGVSALQGKLLDADIKLISELEELYQSAISQFAQIDLKRQTLADKHSQKPSSQLIEIFENFGEKMRTFVKTEPRLQVYSFQQPRESHGEVSRLIAKLRDTRTAHNEFLYYIQRAYELIFKLVYNTHTDVARGYKMVETPVNVPVQNFAIHKMPDVDFLVKDTVMCVLLRGALLPSMIMSKEIQEYSSNGMITPFALFRIKRNDNKTKADMEYIMDLDNSYFNPESLQGKDLIFADPMNATGGSLVAVINYLKSIGVQPKSVLCFNAIASISGMIQVIRSIDNAKVYTLWVDPLLNHKAYIMPGLGDAGDRLNGKDSEEHPRDIIQLLADYGANITNLYRAQVREIEKTVLQKY